MQQQQQPSPYSHTQASSDMRSGADPETRRKGALALTERKKQIRATAKPAAAPKPKSVAPKAKARAK